MERNNLFGEDSKIMKDDNLPIDDILAGIQAKKASEPVNEVNKDEEKEIHEAYENSKVDNDVVEDIDDGLTPLQRMKLSNANKSSGAVYSNEELEKGADGPVNGDMVNTDLRMEQMADAVSALDGELEKRKHVTLIKNPVNEAEHAKALIELGAVTQKPDGSWVIDFRDSHGNPMIPEFFRVRKEGEGEFSDELMRGAGLLENKPSNGENLEDEPEDGAKAPGEELSDEKKKIVQILIDKTGFGASTVDLTPEEKEKVAEADIIKINSVKVVDIKSILAKKSEKTFQDIVNSYDISGSRTRICFPASGFSADMKGLTYGEYADITLSMDAVKFDQYYKRLSIIYNKMTNISTGPFVDFEDFLNKFAYTDIPLALYGMYCSTEPEEVSLPLECGNKKCSKSFEWKFATRNILKLERCADTFLDKMKDIATSPAMKYDKIKEEAAVNKSNYIKLPESGIICEMGIASAYEFIYNFIPLLDENTFKAAFGEDTNQVYMNNVLLLTAVRSVYVPYGDEHVECKGYKDILDALYRISPDEIKILTAYTGKIQSKYDVVFSFGKVVCPHCGHVTNNLDVSMDDLVFQTYNRLMSTEIDLNSIQDL